MKSQIQTNTTPRSEQRALIVEGGGMRGVFTAGVLDAFHDKRFRQFGACYGVSVGALNLATFLAGQRGRNIQIYTDLCHNPQFINFSRFLKGGELFDLDFFFEKISRQYSLDIRRLKQALQANAFYVAATCAETGLPTYLEITEDTNPEKIMRTLKASCSLPTPYKKPIEIDHQPLIDGSLSTPLPLNKVISDGFREIVIIRTLPSNHLKTQSTSKRLSAWQHRNKPTISALIRKQYTVYNNSLSDIEHFTDNKDIHIIQIAPPKPLNSGRSTQNRAKLVADYHLGYTEGYAIAEKLEKDFAL